MYPVGSNDNQKRATHNKAKKFIIQDGVLHYASKSGLRQWITDPEQQRKTIEACYADKLGGTRPVRRLGQGLLLLYNQLTVFCHRKLPNSSLPLQPPADTTGAT